MSVDVLLLALAVVAGLVVLSFAAVYLRRQLLQRGGGTVELALRLNPRPRGGGWVAGIGRFVGDELQWYRVLSLSTGPRRTLSRCDLQVVRRREPDRSETYALLRGAVVLECRTPAGPVELALEPCAVTGFLAWLEARPPGATLPA